MADQQLVPLLWIATSVRVYVPEAFAGGVVVVLSEEVVFPADGVAVALIVTAGFVAPAGLVATAEGAEYEYRND
jgi:hypothetical protein